MARAPTWHVVHRFMAFIALALACTEQGVTSGTAREALLTPESSAQGVGPLLMGHGYRDQNPIAGAFDGTGFVLLHDNPSTFVRLGSDGTLIDTVVLPLATSNGGVLAYSWDGMFNVLAWLDGASGRLCFGSFRSDGTPAFDGGTCTNVPVPPTSGMSARSAGGTTLLAWAPVLGQGENDVFAIRVKADQPLDPVPLVLSQGDAGRLRASVATDGTDFVVSWCEIRQQADKSLSATRVTASGNVLDRGTGPQLATDAGACSSTLAFAGGNYHLFWAQTAPDAGWELVDQRMSPSLVPVGAVPLVVASSPTTRGVDAPDVVFDGTALWLLYEDYRRGTYDGDVYAAVVAPDGTALTPNGVEVSQAGAERYRGVMLAGPGRRIATWGDAQWGINIGYDAWGALLDDAGTPGPQVLYSPDIAARYGPVVATDGRGFVLAWIDERSGPADVYVARVSAEGQLLDDAGVFAGTMGDIGYGLSIVALDGGALVTWGVSATTSEWLRSFDGAGRAIGPGPVLLDTAAITSSALLVGNGDIALVTWSAGPDYPGFDVRAARFAADGTQLDATPISVCNAAGEQAVVTTAWDGTAFVVLWADFRSGSEAFYGAHVEPDGSVREANGVQVLLPPTGGSVGYLTVTRVAMGVEATWISYLADAGRDLHAELLDDTFAFVPDAGQLWQDTDLAVQAYEQVLYDGSGLVISSQDALFYLGGDAGFPAGSQNRRHPRAAFWPDGRGLVTWEDHSGYVPDVRFALLGFPIDAGSGDAGTRDGGMAGAGSGDAGATDAGGSGANPRALRVGLGCSEAGPGIACPVLLLIVARRRRGHAAF
jgi:hypothetical protein